MVINDPEPHLYKVEIIKNVKEEYSQYLCFDKEFYKL